MIGLQGSISLSILCPAQLYPLLQKSCHIGLLLKSPEPAACLSGQGDAICGMKYTRSIVATGQGIEEVSLKTLPSKVELKTTGSIFGPKTDFPSSPSAHAHTLLSSHSRPGLYHFRSRRAVLSRCGIDVSFNSRHVY